MDEQPNNEEPPINRKMVGNLKNSCSQHKNVSKSRGMVVTDMTKSGVGLVSLLVEQHGEAGFTMGYAAIRKGLSPEKKPLTGAQTRFLKKMFKGEHLRLEAEWLAGNPSYTPSDDASDWASRKLPMTPPKKVVQAALVEHGPNVPLATATAITLAGEQLYKWVFQGMSVHYGREPTAMEMKVSLHQAMLVGMQNKTAAPGARRKIFSGRR